MKRGERHKRFERLVFAYVAASGGRLIENPNDLLPAIFAVVPDTNVEEIRAAIQQAIKESNRKGAALERALLGIRPRRPI